MVALRHSLPEQVRPDLTRGHSLRQPGEHQVWTGLRRHQIEHRVRGTIHRRIPGQVDAALEAGDPDGADTGNDRNRPPVRDGHLDDMTPAGPRCRPTSCQSGRPVSKDGSPASLRVIQLTGVVHEDAPVDPGELSTSQHPGNIGIVRPEGEQLTPRHDTVLSPGEQVRKPLLVHAYRITAIVRCDQSDFRTCG